MNLRQESLTKDSIILPNRNKHMADRFNTESRWLYWIKTELWYIINFPEAWLWNFLASRTQCISKLHTKIERNGSPEVQNRGIIGPTNRINLILALFVQKLWSLPRYCRCLGSFPFVVRGCSGSAWGSSLPPLCRLTVLGLFEVPVPSKPPGALKLNCN